MRIACCLVLCIACRCTDKAHVIDRGLLTQYMCIYNTFSGIGFSACCTTVDGFGARVLGPAILIAATNANTF